MVMQNFQTKSPLETERFLNLPTNGKTNKISVRYNLLCKIVKWVLIISLLTINITFLFITVNNNNVILGLRNEISELKRDVDMLKYRFFDDSLLKEIADYENESELDDSNDDDSSNDTENYLEYNTYDDYDTKDENKLSTQDGTRSKREVLAATLDGVPIIAESYAEQKRRNKSLISTQEGHQLYENLGKNTESPRKNFEHAQKQTHKTFHTGWTTRTYVNRGRGISVFPGIVPTPVMTRASRVMKTDENKSKAFRKIVKKSMLRSGGASNSQRNLQEHVDSVHVTMIPPVTRRNHRHGKHGNRRSNLETMDEVIKQTIPAAHFYGNTSHYVSGKHHHYRGNGHLAHPQGLYVDWEPSSWVKSLGMDRIFHMNNGELIVRETGLYFIYAQIYYVDEHDLNGYQIKKNHAEIAQCTTMTHTERKLDKRNTCFTSTVEYLIDGDRITIRDIETMRYAYFAYGKSFFGLYKISDVKMK